MQKRSAKSDQRDKYLVHDSGTNNKQHIKGKGALAWAIQDSAPRIAANFTCYLFPKQTPLDTLSQGREKVETRILM
ncbi:hypothetical protein EUGRSUZ_F01446 [Eucalyptus grandis]|uniref:Uncharacterized protein n=2 Tax=Eucalyptus grandis TaxID=71139 RepID=A0ACC3KEW0_EUCGR|nr:hypothetical protein EUGRSUZ_F01446 [Eucalyptus grandis]